MIICLLKTCGMRIPTAFWAEENPTGAEKHNQIYRVVERTHPRKSLISKNSVDQSFVVMKAHLASRNSEKLTSGWPLAHDASSRQTVSSCV